MAVFAVQNVNDNDEITHYQMGNISSNEAVWRILSFPTVSYTHLDVYKRQMMYCILRH